jgi:hypothetical protein
MLWLIILSRRLFDPPAAAAQEKHETWPQTASGHQSFLGHEDGKAAFCYLLLIAAFLAYAALVQDIRFVKGLAASAPRTGEFEEHLCVSAEQHEGFVSGFKELFSG